MARRKRSRGLGYGCPCVTANRQNVVCAVVPTRKGSRKYKKVCRTPNGRIVSTKVLGARRARGTKMSVRRAAQLRHLRRGGRLKGGGRKRLKG